MWMLMERFTTLADLQLRDEDKLLEKRYLVCPVTLCAFDVRLLRMCQAASKTRGRHDSSPWKPRAQWETQTCLLQVHIFSRAHSFWDHIFYWTNSNHSSHDGPNLCALTRLSSPEVYEDFCEVLFICVTRASNTDPHNVWCGLNWVEWMNEWNTLGVQKRTKTHFWSPRQWE